MQATLTQQMLASGPCAQRRRPAAVVCRAAHGGSPTPSRREAVAGVVGLTAALAFGAQPAPTHAADDDDAKTLCSAECAAKLAEQGRVVAPSGLQYQDIVKGSGPSPPVGYQVVVHYVAMTPGGRIFDNSLERGAPYDLRIGAGQIVPGLDEGIQTMQVGGVRRLYVPGNLAFPKGLPSAAGRPRVPPASPVIFDVALLYIPGLDLE